MLDFTIEQWLIIFIGSLSIFPTTILLKQYYQTRIFDFLLFSAMYFFVSVAAFTQTLSISSNTLIQFQLVQWSLNIVSLLFFIHSSLLIWENKPKLLWFLGISWFTVLMLLIPFWEVYEQPENGYVIFTEMTSLHTPFHPKGAGLVINSNTTIYSTGFPLIADGYRLFGAALLMYAYFSVKPVNPNKKILNALKAWKTAATLLFIWSIIQIGIQFGFPQSQYLNVLIVILQVIVAYISIRIPEGTLMSKAQILRATYLYGIVNDSNAKIIPIKLKLPSIVEYVENLPIELLNEINK